MSNVQNSPIVKIDDDFPGLDRAGHFCGRAYDAYVDHVLISEDAIRERTKILALDIHRRFAGAPLRMLCVLNGAFRFFTLLLDELYRLRALDEPQPIRVAFVRAKSYANTSSTNNVQLAGVEGVDKFDSNENVLIVEDIVDTGLTLSELVEAIRQRSSAKVSVASMLVKRVPGAVFRPDFACFDIPNRFVIGFGLDYNEYFRDLNHVCVINRVGIEKFKQ